MSFSTLCLIKGRVAMAPAGHERHAPGSAGARNSTAVYRWLFWPARKHSWLMEFARGCNSESIWLKTGCWKMVDEHHSNLLRASILAALAQKYRHKKVRGIMTRVHSQHWPLDRFPLLSSFIELFSRQGSCGIARVTSWRTLVPTWIL